MSAGLKDAHWKAQASSNARERRGSGEGSEAHREHNAVLHLSETGRHRERDGAATRTGQTKALTATEPRRDGKVSARVILGTSMATTNSKQHTVQDKAAISGALAWGGGEGVVKEPHAGAYESLRWDHNQDQPVLSIRSAGKQPRGASQVQGAYESLRWTTFVAGVEAEQEG